MKNCPSGQYFCHDRGKCMPIPKGHKVRKDGELVKEVAPPGWGHTKAEKEKTKPDKPKSKIGGSAAAFKRALDDGRFKGLPGDKTKKEKTASMFKLMWSMKKKGDKPHYKPGTDKKYKKYQEEEKKLTPMQDNNLFGDAYAGSKKDSKPKAPKFNPVKELVTKYPSVQKEQKSFKQFKADLYELTGDSVGGGLLGGAAKLILKGISAGTTALHGMGGSRQRNPKPKLTPKPKPQVPSTPTPTPAVEEVIYEKLSAKDAKKLDKASALSQSDNPKDQDRARARQTEVDYKDLMRQIHSKKKKVGKSQMTEKYGDTFDTPKEKRKTAEKEKVNKERDLRMKHGKKWREFAKDAVSAKEKNSLKRGEVRKLVDGKWVSNKP